MMESLFRLDGKVALVTGASKGIGAAMARGLAAFGAQVVVSSRKQEGCEAVVADIRAQGGEATAIAATIGRFPDNHTLIDQTVARYGGIDILINNAASNPVFGPLENSDARAFERIMAVNLQGPFELAKHALPTFRARGGGSIINISSIGGIKPEPMIGLYSVSKAALINLTQAMAQDWGRDNVRANAICPGLVKTRFSSALWQNDAIARHFVERTPLGRLGEPEDLIGLAVFLASDASAWCTGGVYMVDGGYLAAA
jgi:NAD(P)-dependent dehydrogenase (short-subunit alcohol dehydrogenase family)